MPLKISYIAATGESIRIQDLSEDQACIRELEWAQRKGLVGFAGRSLVFRGEVLGVLAVFRRTAPNEVSWEWLHALADHAAAAIANARVNEQIDGLRREPELERDYSREKLSESIAFGDILGRSASLGRILRQVEIVAATNANVLIQGESGTGKELIARAIHERSPRSAKPLVKVNCGSIPRELFESEFFGHVKGSFTGAIRDRIGRFQLADRGTLFLDEVGEIPLELQSKLLRVLQEGEFERVGDDATRRVDVRVVAATNRDLNREVAEGRFRLDLFYRLGVFPVEMPPLRDRLEDIPILAAHFIHQACVRSHVNRQPACGGQLLRLTWSRACVRSHDNLVPCNDAVFCGRPAWLRKTIKHPMPFFAVFLVDAKRRFTSFAEEPYGSNPQPDKCLPLFHKRPPATACSGQRHAPECW